MKSLHVDMMADNLGGNYNDLVEEKETNIWVYGMKNSRIFRKFKSVWSKKVKSKKHYY